MSCGQTSCPDFGPFPDADGSDGMTSGFLQVVPTEFTREELRAFLSKARALAQYGIFDDTKRDLLIDLAETLDLLDAIEARDEADLAKMTEAIRDDPQYAPRWTGVHMTHKSPRCGPHCPMRFIGEA